MSVNIIMLIKHEKLLLEMVFVVVALYVIFTKRFLTQHYLCIWMRSKNFIRGKIIISTRGNATCD